MIGVFDSGVGGIQTLQNLSSYVSNQQYLFLADTKNLPYGNKSPAWIRQRTEELLHRMFEQGCDMVIIACNTAAAATIQYRQENYPAQKVLSVTIPCVEKIHTAGYRHVSVLATQVTVDLDIYASLIHKDTPGVIVDSYGLTGLVSAIETQDITKQHDILAPMIDALHPDTDAIVLGCTHFPIAKSIICQYTSLPLVDSGYEAAIQLQSYLMRHTICKKKGSASAHIQYYVTGDVGVFAHTVASLYGILSPFTLADM